MFVFAGADSTLQFITVPSTKEALLVIEIVRGMMILSVWEYLIPMLNPD